MQGSELLLRAEMKVPGKAWLQFKTYERQGISYLVQTAYFVPHGFIWIFVLVLDVSSA